MSQSALLLVFRELRAKYKVLARLLDAEDYEKLVASLKSESGVIPSVVKIHPLDGCPRKVIPWDGYPRKVHYKVCLPVCLLEEKQLKQRIKELTRYRKSGITSLDGGCGIFLLSL